MYKLVQVKIYSFLTGFFVVFRQVFWTGFQDLQDFVFYILTVWVRVGRLHFPRNIFYATLLCSFMSFMVQNKPSNVLRSNAT